MCNSFRIFHLSPNLSNFFLSIMIVFFLSSPGFKAYAKRVKDKLAIILTQVTEMEEREKLD